MKLIISLRKGGTKQLLNMKEVVRLNKELIGEIKSIK